jgi:hypothetical protein
MAEDRTVDQDVPEGVEVAEKGPGFERKVGEPVTRRRVEVETADRDLYIVRDDLDGDSVTFVAAGATIPPDLAHLPRRQERATPRKR